jgi:hypothetical protein
MTHSILKVPDVHSSMTTRLFSIAIALCITMGSIASATTISGDPSVDAGWTGAGNSLDNGVYVTGSANYGFDVFSSGFTVQAGSNLDIDDGTLSWEPGDTVVGVGGKFQSTTASEAGWGSFSGASVNSNLPTTAPYSGPKLQVKFGTNLASWTTSTAAPGSGNGNSSSSNGGGRVQVRTSGFFQAGSPLPGQDEPWTWDGNSGQVLVLDKDDHIAWTGGSVDKEVARMIWQWDDNLKQVTSWELLLNTSLFDRLQPGNLLPAVGDMAILTVQKGDGVFTDALVRVAAAPVPEPATAGLLGLMGCAISGLFARRRRG